MRQQKLYGYKNGSGKASLFASKESAEKSKVLAPWETSPIFEVDGRRLEAGDIVEVDVVMGGGYSDDSIHSGGNVVTMRGTMDVSEGKSTTVKFDSGRVQVVSPILEENQGGFPVRAMRIVQEKPDSSATAVAESEKFAVYQSEGILAVGNSIGEAVKLAGETMDNVTPFNPGIGSGNYDAGVIVDLTHTTSLGGDSEVCSGSSARIRRISERLAAEVESVGGNIAFQIRDDGVLDVWED